MDRSAHVWGKYKALLTVISSYNWWVGFHYISFSWLTAFLKSSLNGKLIGWLNLHFNQSIYERGSARNSLAEGEATFPQGLGQGVGGSVAALSAPKGLCFDREAPPWFTTSRVWKKCGDWAGGGHVSGRWKCIARASEGLGPKGQRGDGTEGRRTAVGGRGGQRNWEGKGGDFLQ